MTTLTFRAPAPLLNLNDRMSWRTKAKHVREWRHAAKAAAIQLGPPSKRRHEPCLVVVSLPVVRPTARRDPHNWMPTIKPIVDGLVDAGVWPDDNSEWVIVAEPTFHRHEPQSVWNKAGLVRVDLSHARFLAMREVMLRQQ